MRKDWILIGIVILILIVGFGLYGFLKVSKKQVTANPVPSTSGAVAGAQTAQAAYFSPDAKVMYFYSDICSHCQDEETNVLPVLGAQGYKLKPMDTYTNPALGGEYNISGTPTFMAPNGDRLVGFQDVNTLKAWLDQHK